MLRITHDEQPISFTDCLISLCLVLFYPREYQRPSIQYLCVDIEKNIFC